MFKLLFWHWWVLTLIFMVIEALALSGLFAAMTLGSLITGGVAWANPEMAWGFQLVLFGTITTVIFLPLSLFLKKKQMLAGAADAEALTNYLGNELVLTSAMMNGFSEIELDGEIHMLKGPEMKVGTKVRVVGTDGDILVVYPLTPASEEFHDREI